jgi:ABC-2 type transport system permease protein
MYWTHVARKDFADAVRSKMFWALSVLMLLLAYIGLYIPEAVGDDPTVSDGIGVLSGVIGFLIPIVALVVGYMSIVGERETGSIRMVLGLPLKRWEVLVGKLVGRTAVVAVPILIGFALAVPFALVVYGDLPGTEYGEFVTSVVLIGATFAAIAVGVSGSVNTRGKALAAVVGVYALFEFFWELIPLGLFWLANGELPEDDVPTWVEALSGATPTASAVSTSEGLWNGISTSEPLVLQEWVSALLLVLWIAVPLAIGYVRFRRADIS